MREKVLHDVFIGLLFLSIWLNFINGYIQSLINSFSDEIRLCLCSFSIIFSPLLADLIFNSLEKDSKTLIAVVFSSVVSLAIRESFVWWKDRSEIKEEIFSELYGNYRSLEYFVKMHQVFKSMSGEKVIFTSEWNKSIEFKWIDQAFKNHFRRLQPKKIFSQTIIDELKDIHEQMRTAINQVNNGNLSFSDSSFMSDIFLGSEDLGVLSKIRNLLIDMNEKKANELFTEDFPTNS